MVPSFKNVFCFVLFLTKMGPMSKDICEMLTHLDGKSPYTLTITCEYSQGLLELFQKVNYLICRDMIFQGMLLEISCFQEILPYIKE